MANSASFAGITPEVYNTLNSKLSSFGIELKGNKGKISEKGVSAEYDFDEANQTLSISGVNVSFPASMMFSPDKILSVIAETITKAGGRQTTY